MTHPSSATILALLDARCPDWRTRHGNAHEAIRAVSYPPLTELYAQWLGTDAGRQYLASRAALWQANAVYQREDREYELDQEAHFDFVEDLGVLARFRTRMERLQSRRAQRRLHKVWNGPHPELDESENAPGNWLAPDA